MQLRPYQHEALRGNAEHLGIYPALQAGRSALLSLATGLGKTIIFAKVVEACFSRGKRSLILAHRDKLLEQAEKRLLEATSIPRMEIGLEKAATHASHHHGVVLGSVQSMKGARLRNFDPEGFGLVVVDEAHHAPSGSYRAILDHFPDAKVLGVTATPYRYDGQPLEDLFENLAYDYSLVDAITDGWACRVKALEIHGAVDLREVGVRGQHGDFKQDELGRTMSEDPVVAATAKAALEHCTGRPTIIFTAGREQNKALSATLNAVSPGIAVTVDGTMAGSKAKEARRSWAFSQFESGKAQFLINCEIATEGYDFPPVAAIVMARPTRSLSLYMQMLGRGTRVVPGKDNVLVLDLVGLTADGTSLTAVGALGGSDERVLRKASKKASEEPADVVRELDRATSEVTDEDRRRAVERTKIKVKVSNALSVLGIVPAFGEGRRPATRRQLERLARHGVKEAERQLAADELPEHWLSHGDAEEAIRRLHWRFKHGLCTPRMAVQLAKRGLPEDVPFEAGQKAMKVIAEQYKWRPPKDVIEQLKLELEPLVFRG